ncbi:MAG: hypothetical protein HQL49_13815 [Gammaproteobacteria bacterium]|nr:hypothetical protein [Gammaproteobacteria bacterium]
MSEANHESERKKIQVHIPPELEYCYRDLFNIYAGAGEVIIEFGNHHRCAPEFASISNRIVLSVQNSYNFVEQLENTLRTANKNLQRQREESNSQQAKG